MNDVVTEREMKIKALVPWFGSKRRLAPLIVEELGEHRGYWEPFCGSMSVLLAKPAASAETVNDLHGDLINLARVIRDRMLGPRLYRQLRRTWMDRETFELCAESFRCRGHGHAGHPNFERAYDFFVSSWLGRNGVQGTQSYNQGYSVRYTKNGGHGTTRFRACVDSVPAWRRRMAGVVILNDDGFELLEKIEDARGVAIYADPPYLAKGAKYVHDFEGLEEHQRLAHLLSRFKKTRVVVSYYEHPKLRELYLAGRWMMRKVHISKALVNAGMRDGEVDAIAPEVLLINGPSLAQHDDLLMF